MIVDSNIFRYVRFLHDDSSECRLVEFELTGIIMSSTDVTDVTSHTSDLIFNDGLDTPITFSDAVIYKDDHTPIVTEVSPRNGDVFGGYSLTLTGTNLDFDTPVIMIDGQ